MPYMWIPDPPPSSYPFPHEYPKERPHPDNIERAMKLLDKLEKKRVKKDKDVKDKKKNTKERWIPNPDFEDKPRMFSVSELTAILMLLSFPLAIGQIFLYKWVETFIH